ncbi:thymidylate synthase (FAD) [Fontibacillus solani]|uniref:FAD-dependent thymidylate synthase n=1 Tax=Fontibacillus solani TaxID=1572857 RepID=A0A7W3XST5_9BACL|nr:FAD-dependent thymidylate synthase [Fontibacillus solani]MBA9086870.1 thymidylate synthase (FAD) [Fontibacillus solani]
MTKINVHELGYVRLVNVMGSDLTIVNAARVSYEKESFNLNENDISLLKFLAREGHTSPFRHALAQFEIYAPLMVARQWWKYIVGSAHMEATGDSMDAWNESSRRYVTEEPTFYIPKNNEWRSKPLNSKQGSGDYLGIEIGDKYSKELEKLIELGVSAYEAALADGVCAEQARLFLPSYGMYIRWYWTASLQSISHFIVQRSKKDAQKEIRDYATAIIELIKPHFPASLEELIK